MRRGVGVSNVIKQRRERAVFKEKGEEITDTRQQDVEQRAKLFKEKLEAFAKKYSKNLNDDPEFRNKFQRMCTAIGVDPLCSSKGFWAEILGVGPFFYELGIQLLHVSLATRDINGGIMQLSQIQLYLQRMNGQKQSNMGKSRKEGQVGQLTEEDIKRAVTLLEPLGNGVRLVQAGHKTMLLSSPIELLSDHTTILDAAHKNNGRLSVSILKTQLNWEDERAQRGLDFLQSQSMAWLDSGMQDGENLYWFPSIELAFDCREELE